MSLAILNSDTATVFERPVREHIGVVARERLEFVWRGDEGQLGHLGDLGGEQLGKFRMGVQPGADRGASLGELVEPVTAACLIRSMPCDTCVEYPPNS